MHYGEVSKNELHQSNRAMLVRPHTITMVVKMAQATKFLNSQDGELYSEARTLLSSQATKSLCWALLTSPGQGRGVQPV